MEPFINKEEKETWPDGHETWVSTTKFPLRDKDGSIIGTFGISRDINERKKIEMSMLQTNEALEKSNAALQTQIAERRRVEEVLAREGNLLRAMMDGTSDRIFFKDRESRFILVNRAQAEKLGLRDSSEANGKTEFNFFTEDHTRRTFLDKQQIMESGKPVLDLEEKETWLDGRETWVSSTKFPMYGGDGGIIGTFGISRDITERKAMELSIELANEKLAEMVNWLEGRNRDISVLNEMGKMLEACRSPEDAYAVISSQMAELIPVHSENFYLADLERGRMTLAARWGENPDPGTCFDLKDCEAIQGRRVYSAGPDESGSVCPHWNWTPGKGEAFLCIPLISQSETIGVLHLRGRRDDGADAFPDAAKQLAVMASDQLTLALGNIHLREYLRIESIRDALTGLFNRRYLEDSLIQELARTKRRGTTLGVIMMDVDRLKQVNDTCGHEAGDLLLKTVGRWLQTNIRTGDISCRYGGDEFVVIFPDASLETAIHRARQICEGIRGLRIDHKGKPLHAVSVSIGIAGYPTHGETRDELLAAADAALYAAKQQGRDRVAVAGGQSSGA
ncbi:MAG: diguanylate cyclase [Anaerolineales bacterium]|nr:diguanylate cyclase [Anaerolineales bacterium]